jgi:hypothetical protein
MLLGRYFQTKHQMKCIIDISHMKLASADLVLIAICCHTGYQMIRKFCMGFSLIL